MEKKSRGFEYEALKKKALEQFRSGESLFGKDGAFGPMLKEFLELALEAEMEGHLSESKSEGSSNRRNGHSVKLLKTGNGSLELSTPRDRDCDFEPQIVRKRETILADSLEKKILGLYGLGMSF